MRCRHGDGYANSDIDRLNMQRYFYAGLFKRARAMGITDILNQLPLIFKRLYPHGYGYHHHRKAAGVLPQDRQLQHHSGADAGIHGRAQRGQDRLL